MVQSVKDVATHMTANVVEAIVKSVFSLYKYVCMVRCRHTPCTATHDAHARELMCQQPAHLRAQKVLKISCLISLSLICRRGLQPAGLHGEAL